MVITFATRDPFPVSSDAGFLIDSFQNYSSSIDGLRNVSRDNIMLLTYVNTLVSSLLCEQGLVHTITNVTKSKSFPRVWLCKISVTICTLFKNRRGIAIKLECSI